MSFEASEDEKRELEYATQFFEFTPDSYVDTVSFTATDVVGEELNQFRARIKEHFSGKISGRELDDCFNIITDQYNYAAVKILNKLGDYTKNNILRVPRHIVLPEDKVHAHRKFTSDDLEDSMKSIDNLCTQIKNTKYKKAVLQAKLANLQKVALQQEKLLTEIKNLAEQKHQTEALIDSQLKILEEELKTQRPLIQALEAGTDENVDTNELNARKRRIELEKSIARKKFQVVDGDDDLVDESTLCDGEN